MNAYAEQAELESCMSEEDLDFYHGYWVAENKIESGHVWEPLPMYVSDPEWKWFRRGYRARVAEWRRGEAATGQRPLYLPELPK